MSVRPSPRGLLLATIAVVALSAGGYQFLSGQPTEEAATRPDGERLGVDPTTTAGISAPAVAEPRSPGVLKQGLDALDKGDLASARDTRDRLPEATLDRHIMSWAIAMSDEAGVASAEIAAAANELRNWPGLDKLRGNGERAMLRENAGPDAVIEAFADSPPKTVEGERLLARAWMKRGDETAARKALAEVWRTRRLDSASEAAILREFGDVIPASDHRIRMERMLYADRTDAAARVASRAKAEGLAKAWSAVIRGAKDAGKLLDAVPQAERGAGYVFAKARYLRRAGKYHDAAKVLLTSPGGEAEIDPDTWWFERRVLARELLDVDDARTAYEVAASHQGGKPASIADAQFHAGWIALRWLDDPRKAAQHFEKVAAVTDGPISQARAYYWLGRAADAGGPGDAKALYQKAASHGTAFYGQLAAQKLGRRAIPVGYPEPTELDRRSFLEREAVSAIRRLQQAGHGGLADVLYRELAQELESTGELALLATMAQDRGDHFLSLKIGKLAAARGLPIGALAHPTGAIPASAEIAGAGKALAYAVARQESEFRVAAVSGAGAQGLLQLMPDTAKEMAKKAGMPFSVHKLTSDPGYNATLGASFLSEQLGRFDGSYILTFVGYNAGPRRALEWIQRYGDPRGRQLDDVVDWMERIPFTETRNYVQRVMENYQVYKMQLSGRFDIAADLVKGR